MIRFPSASAHSFHLRSFWLLVLFVLCAIATPAHAAQAPGVRVVKDISTNGERSHPQILQSFVTMKNVTYFVNINPNLPEAQLWRTDGTAAGTKVIRSFGHYSTLFSIMNLVATDSLLFFVAWTPQKGYELWKSDGTTAGTAIVKDIYPDGISGFQYDITRPSDQHLSEFVAIGNTLYFTTYTSSDYYRLWRTDGTAAGTQEIIFDTQAGGKIISDLYAFKNKLYFISGQGELDTALWSTDGTNTQMLKSAFRFYMTSGNPFTAAKYAVSGQKLLILGYKPLENYEFLLELWQTDGTPAGTTTITSFPDERIPYDFEPAINSGGLIYFRTESTHSTRPMRLYATNGTTAGTIVLTEQKNIMNLSDLDGKLLFTTSENLGSDITLWKSAGTASTTSQITELTASGLSEMTIVNKKALICFAVSKACWSSDGTASGTVKLSPSLSISHLQEDPFFEPIWSLNQGVLLFSTDGGLLWRSDGTNAGTKPFITLPSGNGNSYISSSVSINNTIYFASNGNALWQTDGTTAGTKAITALQSSALSQIKGMLPFGNQFIFLYYADSISYSVWKSDGTATGTIQLSPKGIYVHSSAVSNKFIYFTIDNNTSGTTLSELWRSDGTIAGTTLVKAGLPYVRMIKALGNKIILFTNNQVWVSDGTANNTIVLKDILSTPEQDGVSALGNALYFLSSDGVSGTLWKTDGTIAGTVQVAPITAPEFMYSYLELHTTGSKVIIIPKVYSNEGNIWVSDGTTNGTKLLASFDTLAIKGISAMAVNGNQFFFSALNATNDFGIWSSDGTVNGTKLIKFIDPGSNSDEPINFTSLDGKLYFNACTAAEGCELWVSDGTEIGTKLMSDIMPGPASSEPYPLCIMNGEVLVNAFDQTVGYELLAVSKLNLTPRVYTPLVGR